MSDRSMWYTAPSRSEGKGLTGFVSLVGAGPGDPMLITRLGFERLRACDTLVFDRLIPTELFAETAAGCERIDVGKIPGHAKVPQEEINRILIEKARAGRRVVRLKGGDPAVFGRVGEEAAALAGAGIPFEIIPGVTAASGAAAAAGIPLTHRGRASSVIFATVHEDPAKEDSLLDWEVLARAGTLAFYMPGGRTQKVGAKLLEAGLLPTCPVLAVQAATLPNQTIVSGTLADLAEGKQVAEAGIPFVLLVGEVAALNPSFTSQRPLNGRSIILTHPMTSPPDILRERLPLLGAQVIDCPAIQIAPPGDLAPLREAILRITDYGWILFTSKNAVDSVFGLLKEMRLDARKFGACRIAAVGGATSRRLEEFGLYPDLVPEEASGKGLAESLTAIGEARGRRFLFPASEIAREELVECLTAQGGVVDRATAYRTMTFQGDWPAFENTHRGKVDGICFASPSALRGFRERVGEEPFHQMVQSATIFSIGPTTTAALRRSGVERIEEADTPGFEEMLETILRVLGG